jgi:hypothetical protein
MMRWTWKRRLWAVALGTVAAACSSLRADDMPKTGEAITLKFSGQPDRVVTVVKSTKKKDGSIETEVKDAKTGESFTLVDLPSSAPAAKPASPAAKPAAVPSLPATHPVSVKAPSSAIPAIPTPVPASPAVRVKPPIPMNPRTPPSAPPLFTTFAELPTAPSVPPPEMKSPAPNLAPTSTLPTAALPEPPREKRFFSRLFSREPDSATTPATPLSPSSIVGPAPEESPRRPLLGRLFGSKKASPPPVLPAMNVPAPGIPSTPRFNSSAEPPQAMPSRSYAAPPPPPGRTDPVLPPTPIVPSLPTPMPAPFSIPAPLPSKPAAPAIPAIPTIPIPTPMPQSAVPVMPAVAIRPSSAANLVHSIGYVAPLETQLPAELQPFATTLRDALPPSHRMTAAKGLAEGRYGSTETVKGVLFHAAKYDPCPAVRACCIEHLCKLGYFDPAFLAHIKMASASLHEDVRLAAREALMKMSPK